MGGQLLLEAGVAPVPTLDHGGAVELLFPGQNQFDQVPEEIVLALGPGRQGTLLLHHVGLLQPGQLDSGMRAREDKIINQSLFLRVIKACSFCLLNQEPI